MIKPEAAGPRPLRRRPSVMPGKSRKYLQIFGSGSPHRRGAAGTCAAEVPMGSHVPAARLAAAVSSVLALSMLVPLGGGTAASAAYGGQLAGGLRQRRDHHRGHGSRATSTASGTRSPRPAWPATRWRRASRCCTTGCGSTGRTCRPASRTTWSPTASRSRSAGPAACSAWSARPPTGPPAGRSPSATRTAAPAPPRSRSPTGWTPAPRPAPTCWPPRRAGTRAGPPRSACSTRPSR